MKFDSYLWQLFHTNHYSNKFHILDFGINKYDAIHVNYIVQIILLY